nr:stage III sporulation protein AA [Frisingicoccus sp.]
MENIFSIRLRPCIGRMKDRWGMVQEIRLRANQPLLIKIDGKEWMIHKNGSLCIDKGEAVRVFQQDIQESMSYICQYSLYAYENEMRQGYITIQGGHRIGIAGQVALEENRVLSICHISSMNVRVAHSVKGCGASVFDYLWEGDRPCHTLILSPPGCGKTTLLRDLIRLFSDGTKRHAGRSVGLVDERSEVAACYMGKAQRDVGMRTDVLDNCPKSIGIEMIVRSMAPRLLAFDELGGAADLKAVQYAIHSGCSVLTTMHGSGNSKDIGEDMKHLFERFVFLNDWNAKERVRYISDSSGKILYKAV